MVWGQGWVLVKESTFRDKVDIINKFPKGKVEPCEIVASDPFVFPNELDNLIKMGPDWGENCISVPILTLIAWHGS